MRLWRRSMMSRSVPTADASLGFSRREQSSLCSFFVFLGLLAMRWGGERRSGLLPFPTGLGSSLRAFPGLPSWVLTFRQFAAGAGFVPEHPGHEFEPCGYRSEDHEPRRSLRKSRTRRKTRFSCPAGNGIFLCDRQRRLRSKCRPRNRSDCLAAGHRGSQRLHRDVQRQCDLGDGRCSLRATLLRKRTKGPFCNRRDATKNYR